MKYSGTRRLASWEVVSSTWELCKKYMRFSRINAFSFYVLPSLQFSKTILNVTWFSSFQWFRVETGSTLMLSCWAQQWVWVFCCREHYVGIWIWRKLKPYKQCLWMETCPYARLLMVENISLYNYGTLTRSHRFTKVSCFRRSFRYNF